MQSSTASAHASLLSDKQHCQNRRYESSTAKQIAQQIAKQHCKCKCVPAQQKATLLLNDAHVRLWYMIRVGK